MVKDVPQPAEMSSTSTKVSGESDSALFSCSTMVAMVIDMVGGGEGA